MSVAQTKSVRRKMAKTIKVRRSDKVKVDLSDEQGDDFERLWQKRTEANPNFPALVAAAKARRAFLRKMADIRASLGKTQTQVAAEMHTSPAVISRLESGGNVNMKTLEGYLVALNQPMPW